MTTYIFSYIEMPSTSVEHSTTTTTQTTLIEASPTGVPSVASPTQTSDGDFLITNFHNTMWHTIIIYIYFMAQYT